MWTICDIIKIENNLKKIKENPHGRKWANIVAEKTAKDGANSKVYGQIWC